MAVYKFSTNSLKTPLKYSSLLAGNPVFVPWAPSGAYDSIATTTLATATATITFSSIPATYTHLQLRGIARTSVGGNSDFVVVRFNSDSGANYSRHAVVGPGGSIYLEAAANATSVRFDPAAASGATTNVFGVGIVDILDYADTSKYKTTRNLSGFDNNGAGTNAWDKGFVQSAGGNWRSTSAVSTITLTSGNGGNFAQYTQFALYGIKGA
jgi:hypothetical protein